MYTHTLPPSYNCGNPRPLIIPILSPPFETKGKKPRLVRPSVSLTKDFPEYLNSGVTSVTPGVTTWDYSRKGETVK